MLVQTAPPAVEPVDLTYLYTRARLIDSGEDALLTMLIAAARKFAESFTGRSFITQSWKLVLDGFPRGGDFSGWITDNSLPSSAIVLDRGTVQSIDSIQYLSMSKAQLTIDPSVYIADLSGCPARITPVFGQIWPADVMPQIASVQVAYTAGYGPAATDVPEGIRDWIAMRVATIYRFREEAEQASRGGKIEPLPWVDNLLDPYRVVMA